MSIGESPPGTEAAKPAAQEGAERLRELRTTRTVTKKNRLVSG